jgi:predicted small integral membrane protein
MIKAKELIDDAILEIKVNKSYYLMAKAASFTILQQMNVVEKGEEYFKTIMTKQYEELDDLQRAFYTIILLLAEIERKATDENLYTEREILEPGDEGYVQPTQDSN